MRKLADTWDLVKTSFAILSSDKELIVLPLTSAFLSTIAMFALFGWYAVSNWPALRVAHGASATRQYPHPLALYALTFLFYVINYFVVIFCNVALIGVANNRMGGGHWKMRDGLELAWDRKFVIFEWAVFAATVGMILRSISERAGILGKIAVGLVGLAWSLAIYFIVPVLAFENLNPGAALKRSSQLFRKTWGEQVVAGISFSLIFALPILAGVGIWIALLTMLSPSLPAMIVSVVLLYIYIQLVVAISSAVSSIFTVALYNYALTGRLHGGFTQDQFLFAWVPKK